MLDAPYVAPRPAAVVVQSVVEVGDVRVWVFAAHLDLRQVRDEPCDAMEEEIRRLEQAKLVPVSWCLTLRFVVEGR